MRWHSQWFTFWKSAIGITGKKSVYRPRTCHVHANEHWRKRKKKIAFSVAPISDTATPILSPSFTLLLNKKMPSSHKGRIIWKQKKCGHRHWQEGKKCIHSSPLCGITFFLLFSHVILVTGKWGSGDLSPFWIRKNVAKKFITVMANWNGVVDKAISWFKRERRKLYFVPLWMVK